MAYGYCDRKMEFIEFAMALGVSKILKFDHDYTLVASESFSNTKKTWLGNLDSNQD